ncbi:hypothetical protein A4X09_0g4487 [Tilletia walkeri]|uniref:Uncharacterized protein n=1 Tax=Tilletia walkeri TaxID=117179 RepID=A0A8X7N749_9BASI|nr:hypothetical protein A4X09_0g4487 [Tilletia walkeri]
MEWLAVSAISASPAHARVATAALHIKRSASSTRIVAAALASTASAVVFRTESLASIRTGRSACRCCIPQDQGSVTGTTSKPASLTSTTSTTTTKKGGPTNTKPTNTPTKPTSTPKPSTCTKNVQCRSGYCRKHLLADGVKRSSVGLCEVKKPSRSRCYQNGGCISGKCRKNVGVCV